MRGFALPREKPFSVKFDDEFMKECSLKSGRLGMSVVFGRKRTFRIGFVLRTPEHRVHLTTAMSAIRPTQMSKWRIGLGYAARRIGDYRLACRICGGFALRNSNGGSGLAREERLQIMLSPEELKVVDNFRFAHRMPSRAAAVRELLRLGIAAVGAVQENAGVKSGDYGVLRAPKSVGPKRNANG